MRLPLLLGLLTLTAVTLACGQAGREAQTPRRPHTQTTCSTDYECPGGTCTKPPADVQHKSRAGVCEWPDSDSPDLPRDPRSPDSGMVPQAPRVDVKPGPSDLHL